MWNIRSVDFASPALDRKYITFIGSGGKTSLMEYMAGDLVSRGRTVAITTTTKILAKEPYVLMDQASDITPRPWVRVGKSMKDGKLTAVSFEDVEKLGGMYDVVLIEGDGAKGKPLKFPAYHEPVIPPFSEHVVVVCGLDGLFRRVDEAVFRWELFCAASGLTGEAPVTPRVFLRLFAHDALLKGVDRDSCTVVLNKYDITGAREVAMEIGKRIISALGTRKVIMSSVLYRVFYSIQDDFA